MTTRNLAPEPRNQIPIKVHPTLVKLIQKLLERSHSIRLFKVAISGGGGQFVLASRPYLKWKSWQHDWDRMWARICSEVEPCFIFLKVDDLLYSANSKWAMLFHCPPHARSLALYTNQNRLKSLFGHALLYESALIATRRDQLRLDQVLRWMATMERRDLERLELMDLITPALVPLETEIHLDPSALQALLGGSERFDLVAAINDDSVTLDQMREMYQRSYQK